MPKVITSTTEKSFSSMEQAEDYFYTRAKDNRRPMLLLDDYSRCVLLAHDGCFQSINVGFEP